MTPRVILGVLECFRIVVLVRHIDRGCLGNEREARPTKMGCLYRLLAYLIRSSTGSDARFAIPEPQLTADLIHRLASDFELRREVRGVHPLDGDGVRIDLMARGKPHLIACGFTDQWFGIEWKWPDRIGGTTSKTTRMVWQSITYAQSTFIIDGAPIRPAFVAVYTPDSLHSLIEQHLNHLLALGLYGNVGRLYFYRDGAWGIKFAYIYARADSPSYYVNSSQLPKRRVGSV